MILYSIHYLFYCLIFIDWSLSVENPTYGWYKANSWDQEINLLYDLTGNGNHGKTINVASSYGKGNGSLVNIPYLTGGTLSSVVWPNGSIPVEFTICSVTRYIAGGVMKKILSGVSTGWFHGHYSSATIVYRGVAYYPPLYLTNMTSVGVLTDWLIMCGKNGGVTPDNILVEGVPVGIKAGGVGSDVLSINMIGENSDWALYEVMIWSNAIMDADMLVVSKALQSYLIHGEVGNALPLHYGVYYRPYIIISRYYMKQSIYSITRCKCYIMYTAHNILHTNLLFYEKISNI